MSNITASQSQNVNKVTHARTPARGLSMAQRRALDLSSSYVLLLIGSVILLIPLFWMVSTSLKSLDEVYVYPIRWIPSRLVWQNYLDVFKNVPFGRYLLNSVEISLFGIVGNLIGSSLAAFSFARMRFPGKNFLFLVMLSTMMVPAWVTMIPHFILFKWLGWLDSYLPILVPAYFAVPFYTFLLRQFFLGIPLDLEDAARIDGCSSFGIYWRIFLPLAKPALATVAIFSFFYYWNDLLYPLIYLQSQDKFPVPMGIATFRGEQYANFALMMAASTMALAPLLVVFFLAQRLFIQGVVITGVKG
ncbi:MAG: carbohydrate ABC transporter permease [Chloroflexi bacterium]|nr:carbohydrate ABC transporter permease [Chloroflexota bacterium]